MGPRRTRILIVAKGHIGVESGYRTRVFEMARQLSTMGFRVRVLWFDTLFSRPRLKTIMDDGTTVTCVPILPFFRTRWIAPLSRVVAAIIAALYCRLWTVDIVQAENSDVACFLHSIGRPLIVDVHGDIAEEFRMCGKPSWVIAQARQDERRAVNNASALVCVSAHLWQVLYDRYGRNLHHCVVPCCLSMRSFQAGVLHRDETRKRLGISDRFVLTYSGGLQVWQEVPAMLSLVAHVKKERPKVFFLLLTQDSVDEIRAGLAAIGLEGRDYLCLGVPRAEIPGVLAAGDMGILVRRDSPVNYVSSPTKLAEYLACGLPVLTTEHAGDAADLVRQECLGIVLTDISPTNDEMNAMFAMFRLVEDKREEWIWKCEHAARCHREWSVVGSTLLRLYRNVAEIDATSDAAIHE